MFFHYLHFQYNDAIKLNNYLNYIIIGKWLSNAIWTTSYLFSYWSVYIFV